MGRPRKHNRHLPRRMQLSHGAYYYTARGRWLPLGRDYGAALRRWAELEGQSATPGRTVADAIGHYLQAKRGELSPRTLEGYEISARNLAPVFGHVHLMDLRPEHVTRYLRTREAKVSANRDKALLSAAYNWVNAEGWLDVAGYNPARVPRNKEAPRQRYVTDVELRALLAAAGPKLGLMIELAYLTGVRRGDLLSIRLADLGTEGLFVQDSKTGKRRTIQWTDDLRAVIDEARALRRKVGSLYLFPAERDPARPMTGRGLHSEWDKVRRKAGLPDVRWHDLRRKAGSDASEEHARQLLDHSDVRVTRRHYRAAPNVVQPLPRRPKPA